MKSSIDMLIQSPESLMTDNKLIRHILELKLILLKHLETAIHEFFVLKTLFQFDPHVGENICQVRACQLISLINSLPAKKYSKEYINKRISCIKKLKGSISKILLTLNKEIIIKRYQPYSIRIEYVNKTLKEFLETNNCTCRLYEYELLLLNLYILSHYKEINNNGDVRIDYARLQNHFNCSKTTARKLIHKYQLRLADCSCKFVKQIVKLSPKLSYLSNILDKLERTDDNGRRILPLFLTTEIIIYNLLTTNVTVIVVIERKHKIKFIDNVVMCFKANPNRSDFIYCGSDVNEIINKYNEPCFFVYGVMSYKSHEMFESHTNYIIRFNKVGFNNVLLADSAIHPQYSGNILKIHKINPYLTLVKNDFISKKSSSIFHRFNERLDMAIKCGYGRKYNISLLFIKHILCDYPKNRLSCN